MSKKPLTAREVATLKPRAATFEHMDPSCPGLGVRVTPAGGKAWIYRYRDHSRRLRRLTLGAVAELSLAEARDAWREQRSLRNRGGDPLTEKRTKVAETAAQLDRERREAAREAYTVSQLCDDYLAAVRTRKRSWRQDAEHFRRDVVPVLGERPAGEVTPDEVVAFLRRVRERGPVMANRVRSSLSAAYSWARDEKRPGVTSNPVRGTKADRRAEQVRDRVLTDGELRRLLGALEHDVGDILRLLVLTGCRRAEACALRWSELDLDGALWRQPGERTKNKKEHLVPLSEAALELLGARQRQGAYVFPGFRQARGRHIHPDSVTRWLELNRDRLGLAGVRVHDLRRTVASGLARLGVAREAIAYVMNHVETSVTGRVYDRHVRTEEAREALERWASHVEALTAENVIQLAGKAKRSPRKAG